MGKTLLPNLPEACPFFLTVVWSSESLRTVAFTGTQMVYRIHPAKLYIKKVNFLDICMDSDTDSKNVPGRIQIQIVKNATICPDNRYLAGYPCIPTLE